MKKISLLLGILALVGCNSDRADRSDWKISDYGYEKYTVSPYSNTIAVIPYNSEEGIERFDHSNYKNAFFTLSTHYAPQSNILSCGIASAVIILNSVYANSAKQPPISLAGSWYDEKNHTIEGNFTWTEDNFFNAKVKGHLDKDVIYGKTQVNGKYVVGVTLDQLTEGLNLQGLTAQAVHATSSTDQDIEAFRKLIKQLLKTPSQYIVVNYKLDLTSSLEGGHFSPIGAYDSNSDSVLILDTWSAFTPWTWVKVYDLYKSMNTKDGEVDRGYILINANLKQK